MNEHSTFSVPLNHLSVSAKNVRTGDRGDIATLARSILRQGVLQNLVVTDGGKNRYEVVAGGRRLEALQMLRTQKKVAARFPVPCTLVDSEAAIAASLTENTQREPMHPLDEFIAFKRLVDDGRSPEDVAALFGVTPRVVTRRLKLANVAPSLLERYRAGELHLEAIMAFAQVESHETQEQAYLGLRTYERNSAQAIRRAICSDELRTDHALVKFVTLRAYRKAGGTVREDLFSDKKVCYIADPALLRSLAQSKIDQAADRIKDEEGAAWVEGRLQVDYAELHQFAQVPMITVNPSAKVAAKLASLEVKLAEARKASDEAAEEDESADAQWDTIDVLEEEISALKATLEKPDPAASKLAGMVVTIAPDGCVDIKRGLIRREDKKALKALAKHLAGETSGSGKEADAPGTELSVALRRSLAASYTAALQARLDLCPEVALRALAARLWRAVEDADGNTAPTINLAGSRPALHTDCPDVAQHAGRMELAASRKAWQQRLGSDAYAVIRGCPHMDVIALLAHCVAHYTDASGLQGRTAENDALAKAAQLDMRAYWSADAAFLRRVPKASILDALAEVDATLPLVEWQKLPKAALIEQAEPVLTRAKWLPVALR